MPLRIATLTRRIEHSVPPLALFRKLTDDGTRPHTALLESAEPESRRHRRSLLMVSASLSLTCHGRTVVIRALKPEAETLLPAIASDAASFAVEHGPASLRLTLHPPVSSVRNDFDRLRAPSPLDVLRGVARALESDRPDIPESINLTGLFSYDLAGFFEQLPPPRSPGLPVPDFQFYLADQTVVVDHEKQQTHIIVTAPGRGNHRVQTARDRLRHISAAVAQAAEMSETVIPSPTEGVRPVPSVDQDDAVFARAVAGLKTRILQGDVFQIVPSRTFSLPCPDPLESYHRLRAAEPSPYLFFLNGGNFTLFGASPESAVRVDGPSSKVAVTPIAGTRPRGRSPDGRPDAELDCRLETELRLDPKENAEHLMLVDLARNDLARVCRPGSRTVSELLRVERFSRVMHLVSRVEGVLAEGLDALHACQACFNLGTLTGAPKLRAMQILRERETDARRHYGGAIGYLMADGSLDTAIVIRAALVHQGMAYVRAGAGVVFDSEPEREAEETRHKAEAVLRAIAHA